MRTTPPLTLLTPAILSILQLACMAAPTASPTSPTTQDGGVTSPEEHLGRPVGIDFDLADWEQISSYYARLAAESPNVQLERLGSTQEGRDFLLILISSAENLARLDEIRAYGRILSDPRGHSDREQREAVEKGRVVLFVSPGMHSTETSPPQMALEFAHLLATSAEEPWRSAREEVVVGLFACTNPDGLAHVVEWYREHVGTAYEATSLDRLYHHYAGHDNNRDWFMLSLAETRLVTEQLYSKWRPQVYWDVHEQGNSRERLFVPPFRDPLNPNIDPSVITGIDLLGTRALMDLNREGFTGISTGVSYDMWWTGGNRNVPTRHNIIGLLTEAASVRIATPVFLRPDELSGPRGIGAYAPSNRFPNPWPGGWWRIRDVIDYELAFARSLLGSLAREPQLWRENSLALAHRALARGTESGPRAWLIPPANPDRAAVRRLVQVLLWTGVEVHLARAPLEADDRSWPAGTIVIRRDQPYGNHVKDLFEIQRYPEGDPPYDVAGWTLPLLLGVHRVEVMGELEAELQAVAAADDALAAFTGDERVTDDEGGWGSALDADTWSEVARRLERGEALTWIAAGERAGLFAAGEQPTDQNGEQHTDEDGDQPGDEEEESRLLTSLPRIGLYAPWSGHMPEGWMRWMLDTYEVPYVSVRNEALRAGALNDWLDVLVLPGPSARQLDAGRNPGSAPEEITRGLDPEGAVAIEEFVRQGGTLVAAGASSNWALELFRLPLTDVTRGEESAGFSCPGSVVRCVPEVAVHTAGLPPSVPVFFSRSSAWRELNEDEAKSADLDHELEVEILARYAPSRVLYSGWMSAPEVIAGQAAWVRADYGEGSLHLFGFRPQYRSWSQAAFHLMFRALFLG